MDRNEFFEKVIKQPNGAVRFVAYCPNLDEPPKRQDDDDDDDDDFGLGSEQYEAKPMYDIWPCWDASSLDRVVVVDGKMVTVAANLVLSLCTDGMHRLTVDIDHPPSDIKKVEGEDMYVIKTKGRRSMVIDVPGGMLLIPSTNNMHGYGTKPMLWEDASTIAVQFDHKYGHANAGKGYLALRPPWVRKPSKKDGDPEPETGSDQPQGKSLEEMLKEEGELF